MYMDVSPVMLLVLLSSIYFNTAESAELAVGNSFCTYGSCWEIVKVDEASCINFAPNQYRLSNVRSEVVPTATTFLAFSRFSMLFRLITNCSRCIGWSSAFLTLI